MKLAIMQPYFFPYIGYFQLIHAVDAFVVYDDVNYIKGGWINRNFIAMQNMKIRISLQVKGASQNLLINQIDIGDNKHKILKSIQRAYAKAPDFKTAFPVIKKILINEEKKLARFLDYQLRLLCGYLGLSPQWYVSSELNKDGNLRGQDKVIAICEKLGATHYINLPGGRDLYNNEDFRRRGLQISFIQSHPSKYQQRGSSFIPNLSIIDVMMFNNRQECAGLLASYDLV